MSSFVIAGRKDSPVFCQSFMHDFLFALLLNKYGSYQLIGSQKTHEGRSTIQLIEICQLSKNQLTLQITLIL